MYCWTRYSGIPNPTRTKPEKMERSKGYSKSQTYHMLGVAHQPAQTEWTSSSKHLFQQAGIPAHSVPFVADFEKSQKPSSHVEGTLRYPVFVKPANMEFLVFRISKATNREINSSHRRSVGYDRRIVVEQRNRRTRSRSSGSWKRRGICGWEVMVNYYDYNEIH